MNLRFSGLLFLASPKILVDYEGHTTGSAYSLDLFAPRPLPNSPSFGDKTFCGV